MEIGFATDGGKLFGHILANFVPGCLFFDTEMDQEWGQHPETVTPGPHRWPRGVHDGIFDDLLIIFGITLGTRGAHVSAFLQSAFLTLFTQAPGTAFS